MHFYKLREAANVIAAEIHQDNENDRADAARCYVAALENAVGRNGIVYRDPISRLPIKRDGIAASMAAHSCVLSERDLNAWLQAQGVGIQITGSGQLITDAGGDCTSADADAAAPPAKPTSAKLASALGPHLSNGHDVEWLKRRLSDADRYPKLRKYRSLEENGRIARWEIGGVVLHLIESGDLTRERAEGALTEHYPQHLYVLDSVATQDEKPAHSWIPAGIFPE